MARGNKPELLAPAGDRECLRTAIHFGADALELAKLDLAYAPPYSSAKDPGNMAGFMMENIAQGALKQWFL